VIDFLFFYPECAAYKNTPFTKHCSFYEEMSIFE